MPRYQTEFDVPLNMEPEDLARFIESLREFGYPKIVFRVEAASKDEAVREVSNSVSVWWRLHRYTPAWWDLKLRNVRRLWRPGEWTNAPLD